MNYKLIGIDLDGTLTQHKSKLTQSNKEILDVLVSKYQCVMVGAGGCERIFTQMNNYPIDIIGNYGMQISTIFLGKLQMIKNDQYVVDRDFFERRILEIREKTGYTAYVGDNLEFHGSGAVTFPLIGTAADKESKLQFDPDGKKRAKIYDLVSTSFENYNCFIGGTSSFDIVSKEYDKYKALLSYSEKLKVKRSEILFIGDDFKKGGNDEPVMLGGIDCLVINDYEKLPFFLQLNHII